ncbi:hypothetical protein CLAFUW4_10338 [Fulvia fulva]|nr:hypothetical protein CLAFUR4_10342 [Fulvia fulva]WPV19569.1 hypothetical protein CLAFUW4_10338 [Fulvia fulva]WPV34450.1 hypothetical protein CLAFUW7_10338 [Fulvia fulva]
MSAEGVDGSNPGRMCLSALGTLEANDLEPPTSTSPALRPPQPDDIWAGQQTARSAYSTCRPSTTAPDDLPGLSFAQYCVAISAASPEAHRQQLSSAFSDYSVETVVPVKPKRRIYRVPSYGLLARFLPKVDKSSDNSKPVDEKITGGGKRSKQTRLQRFLKKYRPRLRKQQESPVSKTDQPRKKDSVLEPLTILNNADRPLSAELAP